MTSGRPSVDGVPMAGDGWIGPQTVNRITDFQRCMQGKGEAYFVDGKVDAQHQTSPVYTFVLLNEYVGRKNLKLADPGSDPECPPELRPH